MLEFIGKGHLDSFHLSQLDHLSNTFYIFNLVCIDSLTYLRCSTTSILVEITSYLVIDFGPKYLPRWSHKIFCFSDPDHKNMARVRNCPDVTILNSLILSCLFVFLPFYRLVFSLFCNVVFFCHVVFLSWSLFVFLSFCNFDFLSFLFFVFLYF